MLSHFRRTSLAIGLGLCLVGSAAFAQSTTGSIFGTASHAAGDTVVVANSSGFKRETTVDANGRYAVSNLPLGTYTVTLTRNGEAASTRNNVNLSAGGGTDVSFNAPSDGAQDLSAVTVQASALPPIDVSSVSSSTILTATELKQLPVARNAEAIALLSPGAVAGSGYFSRAVSFGGAGITENAYYVNGFNTTETYSYTGSSYQLPYGAIDQQQTFTGGYSAKYGRSDGGVINQIGKRGTNEWHFGAQAVWAPRIAAASPKNIYYPHQKVPAGYEVVTPEDQGELYRYRNDNKGWSTEYSVYANGPLIQDKLFVNLAVTKSKSDNQNVASVENGTAAYTTDTGRNFYGKLDWNINDSNVLEYTRLQKTDRDGAGDSYYFDSETRQKDGFRGATDITKTSTKANIIQYTGYLSDAATLSVLYGDMDVANPILYPFVSPNPAISSRNSQNPAYWINGAPVRNDQTGFYTYSPKAKSRTQGLRADFSYKLSDHLLEVGIDNQSYTAHDQGETMTGPGYAWIYSTTASPNSAINSALGVGAPGENYYVAKYIYSVKANMSMKQKAYYLQDTWQVNDKLVLNLGLRNDRFTNYNNLGQSFVDQKNQWEPRLGFSWDVNGDSSLKLFGNVGRYYLALPQSVAQRAATPSSYSFEYFTYKGVDANGVPTGLTAVGGVNGAPAPGPVSANNEIGRNVDPNVVTSKNLKAQYQDEYIVGFDKTLGSDWVYGAQLTYRKLGTSIDDICDVGRIADKIDSMGLNADDYAWDDPGCRIFNPGLTGKFLVNKVDGSGSVIVPMSSADWGLGRGAGRKYYGVNLYLAHPFSDKWSGRVDYTFARSWGNAEGQVRSDLGQGDVSKTEDWDYGALMDGAYGYLANHRRHQIKARGMYQVTPEWLVSGTLSVQSGTPKSCLGYYGQDPFGADNDPSGYGPDYHWCHGERTPPGSVGFTAWTKKLDLGVQYAPAFADNKLVFSLDVFNVLNGQKALQTDPHESDGVGTITNTYGMGLFYQQPRYARLSVSYDY